MSLSFLRILALDSAILVLSSWTFGDDFDGGLRLVAVVLRRVLISPAPSIPANSAKRFSRSATVFTSASASLYHLIRSCRSLISGSGAFDASLGSCKSFWPVNSFCFASSSSWSLAFFLASCSVTLTASSSGVSSFFGFPSLSLLAVCAFSSALSFLPSSFNFGFTPKKSLKISLTSSPLDTFPRSKVSSRSAKAASSCWLLMLYWSAQLYLLASLRAAWRERPAVVSTTSLTLMLSSLSSLICDKREAIASGLFSFSSLRTLTLISSYRSVYIFLASRSILGISWDIVVLSISDSCSLSELILCCRGVTSGATSGVLGAGVASEALSRSNTSASLWLCMNSTSSTDIVFSLRAPPFPKWASAPSLVKLQLETSRSALGVKSGSSAR